METTLRKRAEMFAELPYTVEVDLDQTTENQPIYLACVPELPGCLAQGESIEEATKELREARIDYIESLLAGGLPVPMPNIQATSTSSGEAQTIVRTYPSVPQMPEEDLKNQRLYQSVLVST
ncbi:MAG: type II toxin-antitoxin system HicB family antitoxin [Anaerolineales bacterium]|jgi:predicted RNase H-like HicB family nuclease